MWTWAAPRPYAASGPIYGIVASTSTTNSLNASGIDPKLQSLDARYSAQRPRTPGLKPLTTFPALGQTLWQRRRPRPGGSGNGAGGTAPGGDPECSRCGASYGGAAFLPARPRPAGVLPAGLGDAALRSLLSPSGHHF